MSGMPNLFTGTVVRAIFTGEKLLRATCIFAKSKLQTIASLLYKIGAHFSQYYGNLSLKKGEDQKKKTGLRRKLVLISFSITEICPKKKVKTKKKVFAANPHWFRKYQTKEGFGLDLFICRKMLSKPFHEEINRAKRPRGPHKTASRATCWAALMYVKTPSLELEKMFYVQY